MGIVSGIVVYLIIWWVIIFCTLPLWVNPQGNHDKVEGTLAAAPKEPQLKKKIILTSIISAILWLGVYTLIEINVIDFRREANKMYVQDYGT